MGSDGSNQLFGGNGNDSLYGGAGNDILYAEVGDDSLFGDIGNDLLYGSAGNDTIFGEVGDDNLYGGIGNDKLEGGAGNDYLLGVDNVTEFGVGTIDVFTGGLGKDKFVLGEKQAFYNDGDNNAAGLQDYALITDFNSAEDIIQLSGNANSYVLGTTVDKLAGVGIYLDSNSDKLFNSSDELIAVVQGTTTNMSLTNSSFTYVS
ncbi:hypothetical protein H6G64_11855 [Calothrix sp. FACHB-156]|nr:hypothetical protein [Calothrix sp. FACHB-156]